MSTETNENAMYDVHLFPVVRVKIPNVEASSHGEAITCAVQQVGDEFAERFRANDGEYSEEFSHYLVDVVGDGEYLQSQSFYSQDEPLVANLRRLVNWYDAQRGNAGELAEIINDARNVLKFAV
jgi:hypothetical protein